MNGPNAELETRRKRPSLFAVDCQTKRKAFLPLSRCQSSIEWKYRIDAAAQRWRIFSASPVARPYDRLEFEQCISGALLRGATEFNHCRCGLMDEETNDLTQSLLSPAIIAGLSRSLVGTTLVFDFSGKCLFAMSLMTFRLL